MTLDQRAYDIGRQAGHDAATWLFDGNTTRETYQQVVQGIEVGDPEIMDMQPAPLSGEWAGESIPELSERFDLDLGDDATADAFETGYSDGYWDEVEKAARYQLEDS